jgi:hypothetical protein
VSSSGLVTGNSPGNATITAAYQATSGTSSVTVALGNVTALKITPPSANITVVGGTATFFAYATVTGDPTQVEVTPSANWTVSDPTNFTISVPTTNGVGVTITAGSGAQPGERVVVGASYQSTIVVTAPNATLTFQ